MGVNLDQYRACIGCFNIIWMIRSFDNSCSFCSTQTLILAFVFCCLILSGDIEVNPGPGKETTLSVCHWNLNSVSVDNFIKINQLSAFLNIHNFDIVCLGETFLNSETNDDDPGLAIENYEIKRCDHPSDSKRGGVCVYYRDHLGLEPRPELTTLDECLVFEMKTGANRFFLCICYRSPSQTSDEFENFSRKWEETIININNCSPTAVILLGDFNVKNSDWWGGDNTDNEGIEIQNLAIQHGFQQIIDGPTHILPDSSSCIDLIFSSADHLVLESGILPSLHPRCHHQIIFCKINFKIPLAPTYKRKIWDYSRADPVLIRRAMNMVDWDGCFEGIDVGGQVSFLTETITNIISNFVPNKVITVRSKDAVWMTAEIKRVLREKSKIYERYVKNGRRDEDRELLCQSQSTCRRAVRDAKKTIILA